MTGSGLERAADWWTALYGGLTELVLPVSCAGCRAQRAALRYGVCAGCVAVLEGLRPAAVQPQPPPVGLPPCVALGGYAGELREVLLAYKERGRHRLAVPLGSLLAGAVAQAAVRTTGRSAVPLLLVPVPTTARAIRQRHGDHLARLVRQAARRLRAAGWPTGVARPLRALPRPDSAGLDRAGRAAAAAAFLGVRPAVLDRLRAAAAGTTVVVVDDVVTTGATVAAVSRRLAAAGVPVDAVAVLAATRLRGGGGPGSAGLSP